MEKEYQKAKKIVTADKTVMYTFDGKLHNWDGPALLPQGNSRKREYYINGIKMSELEWKAALKGRDGLPWYKGLSAGTRF